MLRTESHDIGILNISFKLDLPTLITIPSSNVQIRSVRAIGIPKLAP